MLALVLTTAAVLQLPDTVRPAYDSPATRALVERAIEGSGDLPPDLNDYRAIVHTGMYISLAPDSAVGGDLPASVDELVSEVRWSDQEFLHQTVQGHRTRILVPLPYTLATILEAPWVIPHLYGGSIFTPFAGRRAINPFGRAGPDHYRYSTDDPVRLSVQGELITLVPVEVRPRVQPADDVELVVGTFFVDADRGAVARARFGFLGGGGGFPRTLGQIETFFELENGLWEGKFWLPYRQRREVVFSSRLLGGAVGGRIVSEFREYDINQGWSPSGGRVRLAWADQGRRAFADWDGGVGDEASRYAIEDFADLRLATATASADAGAVTTQLHYQQGGHLLRYNRVEGAFLGLGARVVPTSVARGRWEVYGTAGWAFAEETARGEVALALGEAVAPSPVRGVDHGFRSAAYRRLNAILPFRATYAWEWIYTLPAALWGSDERDYYDATGAEAFATVRAGPWSGRAGGRIERHDTVSVNTTRFLFGEADRFPPLASTDVGTHFALEAGGGYTVGPGAFGVGNSLVLQADAEAGLGDFEFGRVVALLSGRRALGPLTAAARVDAGHAWGGVPPQRLFRFGSVEGLRGYEPDEFGGSTAVLARSRLLVGLPPRSTRPLARVGLFLVPPLRPALVLLGETGWTRVDAALADELVRLGSVETGGWRSGVGVGLSIFEDALTLERVWPVGFGSEDREPRWYAGLTYWY
jgi:hypothetical protein